MYENLAWNNFLKTGSIQSFLEYKMFSKNKESYTQDEGVQKNEFNKNQGNCDKRNPV